MKLRGVLVIGMACGLTSLPSRAQIIVNGDFETGDFSGWVQFGDTEYNGVDDFLPHTGVFAAYFGPVNPAGGGIRQNLSAAAGDRLMVRFWLATDFGDVPNWCTVTLDGQPVATIADYTSLSHQPFSATITVDNANPQLVFTFFNPTDFFELDDVTVTREPQGLCYPNCDGSALSPVLTANDFQCFLNRFAAGESYANCDGSVASPTLTANDFQCFMNAYAAGCS